MRGRYELWWDSLTVRERMAEIAKWSKPEKRVERGKVVEWLWRWYAIGADKDLRWLKPGLATLRKFGKAGGFVWSHALGVGFVQVNSSCIVGLPGRGKMPPRKKIVDQKMVDICRAHRLYVNVNRWVTEQEALFWVDEPKPERCAQEAEKAERKRKRELVARLPWRKKEIKERQKAKERRETEEQDAEARVTAMMTGEEVADEKVAATGPGE